ncbi:hypothetical protein Tco_0911579 [Tanacetum coccineum]|uniref:Uncharacterized protein n=1 Tax=Tanacetum coccineum TaxID=301880 RepID=A0ABQ5D2I1_9ASTR
MYVPSPFITTVRPWFATIGYSGEIGAKGTLKKSKNPGAKSGLRRKQYSKHTSESKTEASKSKTGQSDKETQSSWAKDKSPSHPSPSTPVVDEMHKEAQQVAGGPTSLGATSEEGAHPQLSSGTNPSVLVDQTKSARDGLKTAHTKSGTNKESRADEISKKIKMGDLSNLMKDTRYAFFTPDSPQAKPIIVSDENFPQWWNTTKDVSSAGQATASPAEGEKNTNPAIKDVEPNLYDELVDLLCIDVVT